jgi:NAD(P)-dependent dehydrogenase (short-subunit alcohol dehydrogenase family)
MGRMGKAVEVAKVLVFLLSDDASYVTGGELAAATSPNPSQELTA